VKNRVPEEKKAGVVYEVSCHDCDHVYVGETGRTLKKRLAEHKQAVRRFDENKPFYWRRRILEAIRINSHSSTMNLDCGLHLSNLWRPFLENPA